MPHNKEEVARELAQIHFSLEPGMKRIFQLLKPSEADLDFKEPVKLLEVNADTVAAGIQPLHFGARVEDGHWWPPVILVVVTPGEFKLIGKGELKLPHDWRLGKEMRKDA